MKRKLEAKILEELKDHVFQKDTEIKNRHEEKELINATKEALTEMTDIPFSEINKLENQVRFEIIRKRQRNIIRLWVYGIIFLVMSSFLYYLAVPHQFNDKLVFADSFENNNNQWPTFDDYTYNRYFEDGSYIFISNKDKSIYDDEISLSLPSSFSVEVRSKWSGGQFDPYGIRLHLGHGDMSHLFQLHPKNKTNIKRSYDRSDPKWLLHKEDPENNAHEHTQKIIVRPFPWPGGNASRDGRLKYFVNDELLVNGIYTDLSASGNPDFPKPRLSFFVSGKQKVSFDHLKIKDERTGDIIIDGNFEDIKDRLHPKMVYKKYAYIYNSKYYFKTDHKGQCYRAVLPVKIKKHAKIKLTGTWLTGEDYFYGMILQKDLDTYYAFELKRSGTACFIKRVEGKDVIFTDNLPTDLVGSESNTFDITVFLKGSKLEYYVNDQLVHEDKYDLPIEAFGMRVCGSQSVAFDKIEILE